MQAEKARQEPGRAAPKTPSQEAPRYLSSTSHAPSVTVLIPCYNEDLTIAKVVRDFRAELPSATICVFDNNSTDRTIEEAAKAGASVVRERRQGKGYVVQAMFHRLDSDVYLMVDGDGTYPPPAVHDFIGPVFHQRGGMGVGLR